MAYQRIQLHEKAYTKEETDKKLIIVHWISGTKWAGINVFKNPKMNRSSHYIISATGEIIQLVDEKYIAHHAGYSILKDYPIYSKLGVWNSVNPCAIGIELAGPPSIVNKALKRIGKSPTMLQGWPKEELEALVKLCKEIEIRWPGIKLTDHSSVDAKFKRGKGFLKDKNGDYIRGGKIDVKLGKGIDVFPWQWLLDKTGIEEA